MASRNEVIRVLRSSLLLGPSGGFHTNQVWLLKTCFLPSVYAVLFCNAAFSLATTLFNALSSFAPFSFNSWCFLSFLVNMLSQLFHLVSWSVVSILRYVYILKKDWLNQKFPDPSMLKVILVNFGSGYCYCKASSGERGSLCEIKAHICPSGKLLCL